MQGVKVGWGRSTLGDFLLEFGTGIPGCVDGRWIVLQGGFRILVLIIENENSRTYSEMLLSFVCFDNHCSGRRKRDS
jgi:hypothetical protein